MDQSIENLSQAMDKAYREDRVHRKGSEGVELHKTHKHTPKIISSKKKLIF